MPMTCTMKRLIILPGRVVLSSTALCIQPIESTGRRQVDRAPELVLPRPNYQDDAQKPISKNPCGTPKPRTHTTVMQELDHPAILTALGREPDLSDLRSWVRGFLEGVVPA